MSNSDSDGNLGNYKEKRKLEQHFKTVQKALKDINRHTNNNFTCIEECVKYVKRLYDDNSKRQPRRSQFDQQIEDLEEEKKDLIDKLKSTEKKFKKKLEEKDSKIEELTEELESSSSQKDNNKNKSQMKDLKKRISQLENKLEEKDNDCEILEKNNRRQNAEITSLKKEKESLSEELENIKKRKKGEIEALEKTIYDKNYEVKFVTVENENKIKEKQSAIDTIKEKMFAKKAENDDLQGKLALLVVELDECKKSLDDEKWKSKELEKRISFYDQKINELENVIRNNKVNNFQQRAKTESWCPDWWNNHKKENKVIQIKCPFCDRMFDVDKIKGHTDLCRYNIYD